MRKFTLPGLLLFTSAVVIPQTGGQTRRIPQFENERVNVWRTVVEPNSPLTMHRHEHARVIVPVVGGKIKILQQSGESETYQWDAGKAYWLTADPPGKLHADVNAGDKALEVIVVELK